MVELTTIYFEITTSLFQISPVHFEFTIAYFEPRTPHFEFPFAHLLTERRREYLRVVLTPSPEPARWADQPGRRDDGRHHGQRGSQRQQAPQQSAGRHDHGAHHMLGTPPLEQTQAHGYHKIII